MTNVRTIEIPVLIAGGGPVGMSAALVLAYHGIESLVIERRDGPHRAPQAHVVNSRTLEIFRELGLDIEELNALATAQADGSVVRWCTRLFEEELAATPYERQGESCLPFTPTPLLNLSQHLLEPVLQRYVEALPTSRLAYGQQWETAQMDEDGVSSQVRNLADDSVYNVRSRYLIAADGAGSRVRKSRKITLNGPDELQSFVMIHFEANLRERLGDRAAILYWILDPAATGSFVAHDIESTWVFMHPVDADADTDADDNADDSELYDERRCREIVERAMGTNDVPFEIQSISRWRMTAQVADQYQDGRIFLVGDAAHRFPPTGGMGLNTGVQDVHNLAWKIAWVENQRAGAKLLDTYESERKAVAQNNADQSLNNALKMFDVLAAVAPAEGDGRLLAERLGDAGVRDLVSNSIANQHDHFDMFGLHLGFRYDQGALVADGSPEPPPATSVGDYTPSTRPGSRMPHATILREGQTASTLDLVDQENFTVLAGPTWQAWADAARQLGLPCVAEGRDFQDVDGGWAAVRGIEDSGALVLRPDGHVAWRAQSDTATDELASVIAKLRFAT